MNKAINNRYFFINSFFAEKFRAEYKELRKHNKTVSQSVYIKKLICKKLNDGNRLMMYFKDEAEYIDVLMQAMQYKEMSKFSFFFTEEEKGFLMQKAAEFNCCLNDMFKVLIVQEYCRTGTFEVEVSVFLNQLKKLDKQYIYGYLPIDDYDKFKKQFDKYHVSDVISLSCQFSDFFEKQVELDEDQLKEEYDKIGYRQKMLIKFPMNESNPNLEILKSKDRDFFIFKNITRIGEYYAK